MIRSIRQELRLTARLVDSPSGGKVAIGNFFVGHSQFVPHKPLCPLQHPPNDYGM
jgi:hypothetical protein